MVSEALQPLVKELPLTEKKKLLKWLEDEVDAAPRTTNVKLRNRLIKHITKKATRKVAI